MAHRTEVEVDVEVVAEEVAEVGMIAATEVVEDMEITRIRIRMASKVEAMASKVGGHMDNKVDHTDNKEVPTTHLHMDSKLPPTTHPHTDSNKVVVMGNKVVTTKVVMGKTPIHHMARLNLMVNRVHTD